MDVPSNASGASGTMEDRPKDDLPHASKDMKDCAEAPNVNPTCNSDNGGATTGFEVIQQNVDVTRDTELGIDILLQRHRNEIMFELRRLQLGDRPVTGSEERRQAINNLVVRCTGSTVNSTDQTADVSLMTTNSQRPEQVLVEVNALVERRPVSSILQSAAFRSSLEQSLRNALGNQSALLNRGRQQQQHQHQHQHQQHQQYQHQHHQQHQQHQPMRAYSTRDAGGFAAASVPDIDGSGDYASAARPAPPPEALQEQSSELYSRPAAAAAAAWVPRLQPADDLMEESIEQMQHEDLIAELGQLIQSQLVTSALSGPIRQVLETQMSQHIEHSGIDGSRVEQHIRQLPRSRHRRNDFWDMGIMNDESNSVDNFDNISVISATAAVAVPQAYAQSNATFSRELNSLRQQVMELRNMMRLSFDLQLDIQRAIRQEVSAAVATAVGTASTTAATESAKLATNRPHTSSATNGDNCLICLDSAVDTALYQCGHTCLCYSCGMQLRQRGAHCPVCRAPIRDIIRIYRSS